MKYCVDLANGCWPGILWTPVCSENHYACIICMHNVFNQSHDAEIEGNVWLVCQETIQFNFMEIFLLDSFCGKTNCSAFLLWSALAIFAKTSQTSHQKTNRCFFIEHKVEGWTFPLFSPCRSQKVFVICVSLVKWHLVPRDTDRELVSHRGAGAANVRKHRSLYRGRIFQSCVKNNLSDVLRCLSSHISEITSNACLIHTKNILLKDSTLKSTSSLIGHHLPNNSCARLSQLNTNNPHKTVSECHLICWQADGSKQADYHPIFIFSWNIGSKCRMSLFCANPQTAFTSPNPCGSLFSLHTKNKTAPAFHYAKQIS